jgi:acyl-CoA hydrolase
VSRIVPALRDGTRITTPRYLVDYVVTEYGAVELRGKSDAERARALTRIAHPAFRESLERSQGAIS